MKVAKRYLIGDYHYFNKGQGWYTAFNGPLWLCKLKARFILPPDGSATILNSLQELKDNIRHNPTIRFTKVIGNPDKIETIYEN